MRFMRQTISAFNPQTILLLIGIALVVGGLWYLLGLGIGLVALGLAMIVIALLINQNANEGR